MLRFVPNDIRGMPQRRTALARACESCRRRKKRCEHSDGSVDSPDSSLLLQGRSSSKRARISSPPNAGTAVDDTPVRTQLSVSGRSREQHSALPDDCVVSATAVSPATAHVEVDDSTEQPSASSEHHSGIYDSDGSGNESRFIGHLNPEGAFLIATSPANNTVSGQPEEIGIWLSTKSRSGALRQYPLFPAIQAQSNIMYSSNPVVADLLLPHLEDSCLSLLPSLSDFDALCTIYFDEFHPLFPILDRQSLETSLPHTFTQISVRQIICLIASSSSSAEPYLSLSTAGPRATLKRSEFARQLSLAVRTALSLELIKERLTLCQVCALYSMYTQLADDRHLSVELCARAVALSQTLGLHLPTRADQQDTQLYKRVFCCIWVLDRLNAAFQGRPVTMHERDIGIDLEATFASQDSCFQLILQTTLLLDKIIDLYRPKMDGSEADWGPDFPDFESIVHDAGALRVKANLLATVEIYYHATAILSCRSQALPNSLRRSPSYLRQSLSANRVLSIVSEELKPKLSPVPIVPYAVSLALRFFYREFRYTKLPLFRTRAQKQLVLGCGILRDLGEAFPSAAAIANMVQQLLDETGKAYSSMVQTEESEQKKPSRAAEAIPVPEPARLNSNGDQHAGPGSMWDNSTWDSLMWDNLPDIDIFQHFDPNFDLDAVDAALADDTQPVFPITFGNFSM